MGVKLKPGEPVFWLSIWPKQTGIYTYIHQDKYPKLLLRKEGDSRDYFAGVFGVFSLKDIETILTHPDLEKYFTVDKLLAEKEQEIERLRKQCQHRTT